MLPNWVKLNLVDLGKGDAFQATFDINPFEDLTFEIASDKLIDTIYDSKKSVYLGLSGGMDSEYICKKLIARNAIFTPVIVKHNFNKLEIEYANHFCYVNDLKPVIIELSDRDLLLEYKNIVDMIGSCTGPGTIPAIFAMKQFHKDDIFILGTNLFGDGKASPTEVYLAVHDFYVELYDYNTVHFFIHNEQITFSMLKQASLFDRTDYFKTRLYDIPYRPKMPFDVNAPLIREAKRLNKIYYNAVYEFEYVELLKKFNERLL